jgi:bidirectional [NiFe] hydrogenase diaphorase subunit
MATLNPPPAAQALPKNDPRVRRILTIMSTHGKRRDSLIQVLHAVQELFGYLPKPIIELVAKELRIPASQVYGVVTFYHFFTLKPRGEHSCVVCTGTACYVKGANNLIEELEKGFGIKPGEVTKDNKLGIQTARCIGSCGLAPAVVYDGEVIPRVKPGEIVAKVQERLGAEL